MKVISQVSPSRPRRRLEVPFFLSLSLSVRPSAQQSVDVLRCTRFSSCCQINNGGLCSWTEQRMSRENIAKKKKEFDFQFWMKGIKKISGEKEIKHFKIQNPKCFNILGCFFCTKDKKLLWTHTHTHSNTLRHTWWMSSGGEGEEGAGGGCSLLLPGYTQSS